MNLKAPVTPMILALAAMMIASTASAQQVAPPPPPASEEVIELSPFTVTAAEDGLLPQRFSSTNTFLVPGGRGVGYSRFDLLDPREMRVTTTFSF